VNINYCQTFAFPNNNLDSRRHGEKRKEVFKNSFSFWFCRFRFLQTKVDNKNVKRRIWLFWFPETHIKLLCYLLKMLILKMHLTSFQYEVQYYYTSVNWSSHFKYCTVVCYTFRPTDCFQVTFDHFWSKGDFEGSCGSSKYCVKPKIKHQNKVWLVQMVKWILSKNVQFINKILSYFRHQFQEREKEEEKNNIIKRRKQNSNKERNRKKESKKKNIIACFFAHWVE